MFGCLACTRRSKRMLQIEKAQQRIYDLEDHLAVLQGKQPKVRKNKPKKDKDAPPPKKISASDPDRVKAMLKKAALALDKLTSQKRLKVVPVASFASKLHSSLTRLAYRATTSRWPSPHRR